MDFGVISDPLVSFFKDEFKKLRCEPNQGFLTDSPTGKVLDVLSKDTQYLDSSSIVPCATG